MSYWNQLMGVLAGGGGQPVPSNNLIALLGDSRTASSSYSTSYQTTGLLMQTGYAPWMLAASGYRVEVTDNYAVAGQDLWYNRDQLDSVPGSASSVYKGNVLNVTGTPSANNPSPTAAGGVIFLAGVNGVNGIHAGFAGSSAPWSGTYGTKQFYDEIIGDLSASGKIVLWGNEMPNNNDSGSGTVQLDRRAQIDAYAAPSPRVQKMNTWDVMADTPGSNTNKAGYYGDNVHQTRRGARALGEYIGSVINTLYASFPVRNQLPAGINSPGYVFSHDFTNGTGTGTNITGSVFPSSPTTMTATRTANAGITVTASRNTTAEYTELVLTFSGTGSNAANSRDTFTLQRMIDAGSGTAPTTTNTNGIAVGDGDRVFTICHVSVDAGAVGLLAVGPSIRANCSGLAPAFDTTSHAAEIPPSEFAYSGDMGSDAWSYALMSQPVTIQAGWNSTSATGRFLWGVLQARYKGDSAVSFTIRVRQFGMVNNR